MIEYISANLWQLWLVVAFICLILELSMGDFFITCFAIGAVAAAAVSPFFGFYVQLFVFALVAVLSIFFVRPFALRYLHRNADSRVSNADAVVGRTARVTEPIEAGGYGRVAIDGDIWRAKSADGLPIASGASVSVTARESTILTVAKV
ncbi:MAG: NfeD family protein [Prevotella sp.]|nr:NfeD family protein [Prevotella sp.]